MRLRAADISSLTQSAGRIALLFSLRVVMPGVAENESRAMNPFYFALGGLVFAIAIFRRELLIRTESFRIILIVSVGLFFTGLALHLTNPGRNSTSGALLCPLFSLGLYRLCYRVFVMRLKREPRDTFFNWDKGMGADRVFNIVYFVLTAWLWMLTAISMEELAKAGW